MELPGVNFLQKVSLSMAGLVSLFKALPVCDGVRVSFKHKSHYLMSREPPGVNSLQKVYLTKDRATWC